jgi:nitrite reductase/ring-hydroxylating ferredoxin subunit
MTTATDIRRQREEACAHVNAAGKHYQSLVADYVNKLNAIQARCPHENVSVDVSQVAVTYTCPDCGKALED